MEKPKTSELAREAGISPSYASEVLSGARKPSRPLAIHIFRKTGWRHSLIAGLTDEQIDTLEAVEPWVAPTPTQQGEAA
ncbi:MAG TPA: helix-turn-helix transcriptional regulator [Sphingopyxis sp.]|nr:helix-turn-helix transcriptional regulator [Sphingopyxis sp.]